MGPSAIDSLRILERRHGDEHIISQAFTCRCAGNEIPGIIWLPSRAAVSMPLVLVQHGGSGHKQDGNTCVLARALVEGLGCAVAAIDGPVHGERRALRPTSESALELFRESWVDQTFLHSYVAEWAAVIRSLAELDFIDEQRIGWCGVSMGTAYGLPLISGVPAIKAAVLGKWSSNKLNSRHLLDSAAGVRCPVLFIHHWDDERFDLEGAIELFGALGSEDKRMCIYRGPHNSRGQEEVDACIAHLSRAFFATGRGNEGRPAAG